MAAAHTSFLRSFRLGRSFDVRFAPDESSVAATGRNVVLWAADRKQRIASAHPLANPTTMDFSPNGELLIVKNTSGDCALLDARSLELLAFPGGKKWGEGSQPVFAMDSSVFVDGSWKGDLLVRTVATGEIVYHDHEDGMITHVVCSPDRMWFAYSHVAPYDERLDGGGEEVRIRRWPFVKHRPSTVLKLDGRRHVLALALDGAGRLAAIISPGSLSVWSIQTQDMLAGRDVDHGGTQMGLSWSATGELAVAEKHRGVVLNSDLDELWAVDLPYACCAEFSPSGDRLALGSWEHGMVARLR